MEQTSREALSHNKAAKDHTRETTLDSTVTKRTHKTSSNHEALTNQTRDTVCTQTWTCADHVIACGDHDGTR
jgi:hypothetical protein